MPQYEDAPVEFGSLFGPNITLTGGPAPARAYIETLMPDVLAGCVDPGRVFDREITLDQTPQGYKDMDTRQALKDLARPWDVLAQVSAHLASGGFVRVVSELNQVKRRPRRAGWGSLVQTRAGTFEGINAQSPVEPSGR